MNNKNNKTDHHLNEDQILMALVDEAELAPELQSHLAACSRCGTEKTKIEQRLSNLSHMAKQMAPTPTRRIHLPEIKRRSHFWQGLSLRPALGVAVAAILVLMVVWLPGRFDRGPELSQDMLAQEMKEDNQFMAEIGTLVENALPQGYQDILTVAETEFEEDFMYYIVPPIEYNDSPSLSQRGRGALKC